MELQSTPVKLKHNEYWGRRSGMYMTAVPKGHTVPWGNVFKISRGGNKSTNNNGPVGKRRTRGYYVALREFGNQARRVGWFNGLRIKKKGS